MNNKVRPIFEVASGIRIQIEMTKSFLLSKCGSCEHFVDREKSVDPWIATLFWHSYDSLLSPPLSATRFHSETHDATLV